VSQLVDDDQDPEDARDLMQTGLDVAAEYVEDGTALGLKSGRPHYEVSDAVWDASNEVMCHGFSLAAEIDCAIQLHAEGSEDLTEVTEWAEQRGLPAKRVVKHYAGGRLAGPTKSVISNKDDLELAVELAEEESEPFMMETDFIDDPDRPGAVLGPKTVPRRVRWLLGEGHEAAIRVAHVETPADVYGIDTEATLDT
jgi:TatD-related deoxyribonuclease